MTNRGQALLELVVMSSVILLIIAMSITVIYRTALHVYTGHYLYENLICNIHTQGSLCKSSLYKQLIAFPLLSIRKFEVEKIETKRAFKISGVLQIKDPICVNCRPIYFKDSVYVPKVFY